jgi:Na+-translocating ferredoxin:NAD+ oxidoreductase subunit D
MNQVTERNDDGMKPSSTASADQPPHLVISALPHLRSKESVRRIMLPVLIALVPAAGIAIMLHGLPALLTIVSSVGAAVAAEYLISFILQKKLPGFDGSSAITGMLLALSLPPQTPLWLAPLGSVFAITIVKMLFGGLGCNFLNPAMAGRAFLLMGFPAAFGSAAASAQPFTTLDTKDTLLNFLVGYQGGWIGSTSVGALLAGAALLWYLRCIDFALPLSFIGSFFLLSWYTNDSGSLTSGSAFLAPLAQMLSGGVLLAALFMAPDPATSPRARRARLIFGTGCGVLAFLFQKFGDANYGVMQAVLLMNCIAPSLDRFLMHKPFGAARKKKALRKRDTESEGSAKSNAETGADPNGALAGAEN